MSNEQGGAMMSYDYATERSSLFTDEGQRTFLAVRDHIQKMLKLAGAVRASNAWQCQRASGSSWLLLACLDRLVELGEIRRVEQGHRPAGQDEIYIAA